MVLQVVRQGPKSNIALSKASDAKGAEEQALALSDSDSRCSQNMEQMMMMIALFGVSVPTPPLQ